ncbi:hypothetical protein HDR58_09350 [bacterium]|nr:hypothetical protein [bacterium]
MQLRPLKLTIPIITFGVGMISLGIIADLKRPKNTTAEDLQHAKEIVKKHNPYKYIDILENDDCLNSWKNAAKEIEDSIIRTDSLCHKAYIEGSQLINKNLKKIH